MREQEKSSGDQTTEGELPVVRISEQEQRSIAINGIFVLLIVYTLFFASPVLIPITLALLLNLLLSPPVHALERIGIPPSFGALFVVVLTAAVLMAMAYALVTPAQSWIERLPQSFQKIEAKIKPLRRPIEKTHEAIKKLEDATDIGNDPQVQKVEIERASLTETLFSGTPQLLASTGVVALLLYFLLASGDAFLRKLVAVVPTLRDKKRAVEITREIQADISFYLLTITTINIGLGVLVGTFCLILDIEDPWLWGALASLLSFVPFVGPAIMTVVMAMVGFLSFDNIALVMLVPGLFALVVVIANNIVLPFALGKRLTLSPVAIFISIFFWGWLWGGIGALLAVPLLACIKILCERVVPLRPIAEFLTP